MIGWVLLAVPVTAQDASAWVSPGVAEPGMDLSLAFHVASPDLLEVAVDGEVRCTVTYPAGRQVAPCQRSGPLVEARLVGSDAREYVFPFVAPDDLGSYFVSFETRSLLTLPPANYSAQAVFRVVSPGTLPPPGEDPDGDGEPGDGNGGGGGGGGPGGGAGGGDPNGGNGGGGDGGPDDGLPGPVRTRSTDSSAARMTVSSTLAMGVIATALVARRFPLGGL